MDIPWRRACCTKQRLDESIRQSRFSQIRESSRIELTSSNQRSIRYSSAFGVFRIWWSWASWICLQRIWRIKIQDNCSLPCWWRTKLWSRTCRWLLIDHIQNIHNFDWSRRITVLRLGFKGFLCWEHRKSDIWIQSYLRSHQKERVHRMLSVNGKNCRWREIKNHSETMSSHSKRFQRNHLSPSRLLRAWYNYIARKRILSRDSRWLRQIRLSRI